MTMVWSPDYLGSPGKMVLAKDYIHGPADPDVAAYIAAVETADNQGLEEEVKVAYSDFITGCKADGIWDAIKASCILAGARTLSGALVPLVGTAPTNNGPFVSADYNRKTGLVGDGSTKYLNANRLSTEDTESNAHFSCYVNSVPSTTKTYMGYLINTVIPSQRAEVQTSATNSFMLLKGSTSLAIASPSSSGLIGATRSDALQFTGISGPNTQTISDTGVPPTVSVDWHIFKRNYSPSPQFSDARIAFYSIGESLDLALLDTRVSTLISDLGAAIP